MKMLCYYTILKTNDSFHQNELIDMVIDWLENTKNKMEGLNFQGHLPFEYKIQQKHFIIREFQNHFLSIYFSTKDNYKHTHFIVEIIYNQITQQLHLRFSKEMTNDSKYIFSISIPKIFKTIIQSSFIEQDTYAFCDHAYKINHIQQIQQMSLTIPIVFMKTRQINAHQLAKELIGIAHVFYHPKQKEERSISIIYPLNHEEYKVSRHKSNKVQIDEIAEQIRNFHIQNNKSQMLSYESLYHQQLQDEHEHLIQHTQEYQVTFEDEIKRQQKEIDELKELYEILSQEYQALEKENALLRQKKKIHSDSALLSIDDYHKVSRYQSYLLDLIQKSEHNLAKTQIYRKSDILQAILKENGGSQ